MQRAWGPRNRPRGAAAASFAAFLKLFPVYLFIISTGLVAYALAKSGKVAALAGIATDRTVAQAAFPLMVEHLLPPGLRGLVVAGLLSALMGSLRGRVRRAVPRSSPWTTAQVEARGVAGED